MPPTAALVLLPSVLVPLLLLASPASVWPALIGYHAYCLGVSFSYADGRDPRPLHVIPKATRIVIAIVLALLVASEAAAWGYLELQAWLPEGWERIARRAEPWLPFVVYALIANGYVEERFWRGAILARTGLLGGAAAFALMHGLAVGLMAGPRMGLAAGLLALVAGLAWGGMRRRYGALWPCVVTHVAADAAILRVTAALLSP